MNKILNYLEDDNWYKIFDAENEEDIEYKLLEREEVQTLLKEIERLNNIIDKINKLYDCNTNCENIYYAIGVLLNKKYCDIEDVWEEDKKLENNSNIEKLDCDIDFDDNVSINGKCLYDNALLEIGNKINEIIDYLNKEKE